MWSKDANTWVSAASELDVAEKMVNLLKHIYSLLGRKKVRYETKDIRVLQRQIDMLFHLYVLLFGIDGQTNYLHVMFSGAQY